MTFRKNFLFFDPYRSMKVLAPWEQGFQMFFLHWISRFWILFSYFWDNGARKYWRSAPFWALKCKKIKDEILLWSDENLHSFPPRPEKFSGRRTETDIGKTETKKGYGNYGAKISVLEWAKRLSFSFYIRLRSFTVANVFQISKEEMEDLFVWHSRLTFFLKTNFQRRNPFLLDFA